MFGSRHILALFLWCHSYQVILNPFLQLLDITLQFQSSVISNNAIIGVKPLRYSNLLYVFGSPITVEANRVALTPGHEFALKCNIAEYPNENFSWHRVRQYSNKENQPSEKIEEELKHIDDRYIIQNNAIIIKSPTFADVGDYYCRLKNPRDDLETEKMIYVRARPYILDFDIETSTIRSAIIEEGKSLRIPCNVIDDFSKDSDLKVTWQMSGKFDENEMNDVISGEDGIRIESYNSTSHALIIDKVTKDHRRFFKCHVTNGIADNNKSILIRVKDKYNALWPIVGIFIELVILIAVIFIVENRKVEPDRDGSYDRKAIHM